MTQRTQLSGSKKKLATQPGLTDFASGRTSTVKGTHILVCPTPLHSSEPHEAHTGLMQLQRCKNEGSENEPTCKTSEPISKPISFKKTNPNQAHICQQLSHTWTLAFLLVSLVPTGSFSHFQLSGTFLLPSRSQSCFSVSSYEWILHSHTVAAFLLQPLSTSARQ